MAVLLATSGDGDDDGRAGSFELDMDGILSIIEPAPSYRIVYEVEEGDRRSIERLTVRRPFESRLEVWIDEDTDAVPLSVDVTAFGRSSRDGAESGRAAVAIPPSVPSNDLRIEHVLRGAIDADLIEAREWREVAGRACQILRTGADLRAADITGPDGGEWVDSCVDEEGLVLESVATSGGETTRRLVAVDVEVDPEIERGTFEVGDRTIPILDGGGATAAVTLDSRPPGTFLELPTQLPLERFGRFAVVPPQPDVFADPLQRGRRVGTTSDVLREGLDIVVVDRGGSLDGTDVIETPADATPVDLDDLGTGHLVITPQGASIEAELGGGRFVRVSGTVAVDELVALARGLREVEGGELVPTGATW